MSYTDTPRQLAMLALEGRHDVRRDEARLYVDEVFAELVEPDREMLAAGADVLSPAIFSQYQRERIAERVWRAMLDRARA